MQIDSDKVLEILNDYLEHKYIVETEAYLIHGIKAKVNDLVRATEGGGPKAIQPAGWTINDPKGVGKRVGNPIGCDCSDGQSCDYCRVGKIERRKCPGTCGQIRPEGATGPHEFWDDHDDEKLAAKVTCSGVRVIEKCPDCKGSGLNYWAADKDDNQIQEQCASCYGEGVKPDSVECNGNGVRDDCPEDCECRTKAAEIATKQTGDEKVLPF